jgi:hypothetical protein
MAGMVGLGTDRMAWAARQARLVSSGLGWPRHGMFWQARLGTSSLVTAWFGVV